MARIQIPQFKFLSRNIAQGVWETIIEANMEGEITIFDSQKYSKKVLGRMNALLPKKKEFKEDEVRKTWKSYVKFPGVLMMKELTDKNTKFLTVMREISFWRCDTHAQFSWIRCWWVWGYSMFSRNIQAVYLKLLVGFWDLFHAVNPAGILNLEDLCMLCSNSVNSRVIIHRIQESSTSID